MHINILILFFSPPSMYNLTLTKSLFIRHGFLFYLYTTLVFSLILLKLVTKTLCITVYIFRLQPWNISLYFVWITNTWSEKHVMDPCPVNITSDNSYCFLFWCFCLNYIFECIFILCPNARQPQCEMYCKSLHRPKYFLDANQVHIFLHSPFPIYSPLLTYYMLICVVIDKSSITEKLCVSINKIEVALYILIKFR